MSSATSLSDVASKISAVVNRGAVSKTITTSGGSYTIPSGYHNGSGKITGPTLATLVGSNVTLASAGNLLNGVTAYGKNGTKYTGSMTNRGTWNGSITTSGGSVTIPAGYHNGSGKVTGPTLATLVGSNVTLASAANLLSGVTAYGKNGVKYTGTNKGYDAGVKDGKNTVKTATITGKMSALANNMVSKSTYPNGESFTNRYGYTITFDSLPSHNKVIGLFIQNNSLRLRYIYAPSVCSMAAICAGSPNGTEGLLSSVSVSSTKIVVQLDKCSSCLAGPAEGGSISATFVYN